MTALDSSGAGTGNSAMPHKIPLPQLGTNRTVQSYSDKKTL